MAVGAWTVKEYMNMEDVAAMTGIQVGVQRVSEVPEGVQRVSRRCPEGVLWISGGYPEYPESIYRVSCGYSARLQAGAQVGLGRCPEGVQVGARRA